MVEPTGTALVWFRRDLRLTDNPAWAAATREGSPVAAVFVLDHVPWRRAGAARRGLLTAHLRALHARLEELGGGLHLLRGDPTEEIPRAARRLGATVVHTNADVTTYARRRDGRVAEALGPTELEAHWGNLVHEPGRIVARSTGSVHQVFTPFHRAWSATVPDAWCEPDDAAVIAPQQQPQWPDAGGSDSTIGGELAATERLERWLAAVDGYERRRDLPADDEGTSRLSADLRFGTLAARHVVDVVGRTTPGRAAFVRQLAWRDWYAHLVAAAPRLARHAMRPEMDRVTWRHDPEGFAAWREGRTGYPIVDAGMRQLARSGWLHNRVRMITASFLVKDLLVDWRLGEAHFRRELIDYELTQNVGNWQWVAGTGPDASPYFRVLNPTLQSRRFDPEGEYLRRWVPELGALPGDTIHAPWELGPLELAAAGVTLGQDYPDRIVEHTVARERAIAEYSRARGAA